MPCCRVRFAAPCERLELCGFRVVDHVGELDQSEPRILGVGQMGKDPSSDVLMPEFLAFVLRKRRIAGRRIRRR